MGSTTEFICGLKADGKHRSRSCLLPQTRIRQDWTQVDRALAPRTRRRFQSMRRLGAGWGPVSSGMDAAPDVRWMGRFARPARIVASDGTGVSTPDAAPVDNRMRLLEADPRYREAMDRMQFGQWPEVRDLLAELHADYPHEPALDALLNEAQLRADLVIRWGTKIRGRRLTVGQQRFLRRSLPFVLLIGLVIAGWAFYNSYVAPSRRVVAMANAIHNMASEAQNLVQNARYEEALLVYERTVTPQCRRHTGPVEPEMMGLSATRSGYAIGERGQIERFWLSGRHPERSPGFRNVDVQIEQRRTRRSRLSRRIWFLHSNGWRQSPCMNKRRRSPPTIGRMQWRTVQTRLISTPGYLVRACAGRWPRTGLRLFAPGKSADPVAADAEFDAYLKARSRWTPAT